MEDVICFAKTVNFMSFYGGAVALNVSSDIFANRCSFVFLHTNSRRPLALLILYFRCC